MPVGIRHNVTTVLQILDKGQGGAEVRVLPFLFFGATDCMSHWSPSTLKQETDVTFGGLILILVPILV